MPASKLVGFVSAFAFALGVAVVAPHAQQEPAASRVGGRAPVFIDDMLFPPGSVSIQGDRIRPQGVTSDSNAFGWGTFQFVGWDFGVLPIEFSPEVTTVQKATLNGACAAWQKDGAPITCVPHTSQMGYVIVKTLSAEPGAPSVCYSNIGQYSHLHAEELHLGDGCWGAGTVAHEFGHMLGFWHEHQRPDRDQYLTVDYSNIPDDARASFSTFTFADPLGPYDFLSIMHYDKEAFAIDRSKPVMVPQPGYMLYANTMGTSTAPTELDLQALDHLYAAEMRPLQNISPTESVHTRFDRTDFLDAMERLNALYMSKMGLLRDGGLSLSGRPDFQGIATWIFDVYLAARSRGYSSSQAFGIVTAAVTQTDEWKVKHQGQSALPTSG